MDVVFGVNNELTIEWPEKNRSSPISVVQFCLRSGSGPVKSIFLLSWSGQVL